MMRAVSSRFLGIVPLLVCLVACGSAPEPKVTAPTATGAPGPAAGATAAPDDNEHLTLQAPGDEPRREMRYVFHPGIKEHMRTETRMSMSMGIGDKRAPAVTLPPMVMSMLLDPQRVTSDGHLLHHFVVESADVVKDPSNNAKLEQALTKELPKLVGLSGDAETTTRGQTLRMSLAIPPDVSESVSSMLDQMRRSIRELTVAFPAQAVGRGARWTVASSVRMNKVDMVRTVTYSLSRLDGDRGTLDFVVALEAPPQDIEDKGTRMHLESMVGKGQGTVFVDLQHVVPKSDVDLAIEVTMSVDAQGTKQTVTVATKIGMHVERS
jgi:hypothetical protein